MKDIKEIELVGLDKKVYVKTLGNGLEIYLIPYEDKNNYVISYGTKFGSDVLTFKKEKEEYTPPLGIAHYLEHKMFEQKSGEDPFTFFAKSGADSNAQTSYDNTYYICYGNKSFKENLRYLIKFVSNPYFTDENVEKEKGIITEEINMYGDIPDYKLEMRLRENLYHNDSRKYDIAGTVAEIKRITKEDLYKCYESFYVPNNMFIMITGKFDIYDAIDIIEDELEGNKKVDLPEIIYPKEPKEVVVAEEKMEENIEIPKIAYGIKVPKKTLKLKGIELDLYLSMLTTMLFGSSSDFRENMRVENIMNEIYTEWENTQNYKTFYLIATTKEPDKLTKEIKNILKKLPILKENFDRIKKVWIANEIKLIDNIELTQNNYLDDIINYGTIIDKRVDLIRKMDFKKLEELVKKLDLSNTSIVTMTKKEKSVQE